MNIFVKPNKPSTSSASPLDFSLTVGMIGCVLVFTGKATEGTVTAASGLISTTLCAQVAKDASEKLDRLVEDLKSLE